MRGALWRSVAFAQYPRPMRLPPLLLVGLSLLACEEDAAPTLDGDATTFADAAADVGSDARSGDEAGADVATREDAVVPPDVVDAAADVAEPADSGWFPVRPDIGPDTTDTGSGCPPPEVADYSCDPFVPETCPEGVCIFGMCLGPIVDQARWEDCSDGACGPCESAESCPADCAEPPVVGGAKDLVSDTTLTVEVHGFHNVTDADWEEKPYGGLRGGGDLGEWVRTLEGLPDGRQEPEAPNQVVGVEYYGAHPADWLSEDDAAEIETWGRETADVLRRYGLVVAKFIRWRMAQSGATHVNLVCHSMGCHVIRYLIEHDLESLASDNVLVRWATSSGVIAGARLARLFDNPTVREAAVLLPINTADFVHLHPDYVRDASARWDHRPREANNPLFSGMLIHHTCGTDPWVSEAGDLVALLDLNNPADEPNDGIVYTFDEFFHEQAEPVRARTLAGAAVLPTRSFLRFDHFEVSESTASGVLAAAGLFHSRKVRIALTRLELLDDREKDGPLDFEENGEPPAEIVVENAVRYDPWLHEEHGLDVVVQRQELEDRSLELITATEGEVVETDLRVFEGPVFDGMDRLQLHVELLEVDWYHRLGIHEWGFDPHQGLLSADLDVPLEDGEVALENERVRATLSVRVERYY